MVKRVVMSVVTVFAGMAIGVLLAVAGHGGTAVAATPPEPTTAAAQEQRTEQDAPGITSVSGEEIPIAGDGYFIKEYKGRVSVIKSGSEVPEMIFDIQTKMLPEIDRVQLSEGIYVDSYEAMIKLVEDYIS